MSAQKIEDAINEKLTGDAQKKALDFVAYLAENDISPEQADEGVWGFSYQNKSICVVLVNGAQGEFGPWTVFHSGYDHQYSAPEIPDAEDADKVGLSDCSVDEQLKAIAWAHVKTCLNFTSNGEQCGCGNHPGRRTTVFGKEFDNVCTATLAFTNPDAETLKYVKKLAELMKAGHLKNS